MFPNLVLNLGRRADSDFSRLMSLWSRREVLGASSWAMAGVAFGAAETKTAGVVGSQLYGWGQYYQREGKDMNAHLDEVF